jgi:flagellar basal-body rod protein FlgG
MLAQQRRLGAIAGNIANVSTDGYKRVDTDFTELVSSVYESGAGSYTVGNGIAAGALITDFGQGELTVTGGRLDLGIDGEGFFTLSDGVGRLYYSRGGSFHVSVEEGAAYLVSSEGYYLLDTDLNRVKADENSVILGDGTVIGGDGTTAALRVVNFINPDTLARVGGGLYQAGGETAETAGQVGTVVQGSLESSNVDIATEMTELIKVQRMFEFNSKIVRTIDEMQGMANSLRE